MLAGEKVLVTGGQGPISLPVVRALVAENEVHVLARFTRPEARRALEALGAHCIALDLEEPFASIPDDFGYVFHSALMPRVSAHHSQVDANAHATGRLMHHCRKSLKGFVFVSTCSIYQTNGATPLKETGPLGTHVSLDYTLLKYASEQMVVYGSTEWGVPATTIRVATGYGPSGGAPTTRLDRLVAGEPIVLNPDKPNYFRPTYESDGAKLSIAALTAGRIPALIVNWCGEDIVSAEEYLAYLGELVGIEPRIVYDPAAYTSLVPDTTLMHEALGHGTLTWRQGMRLLVEARYPELLAKTRK